ncbi:unnamed protein product [Ixodes hexagonus]
MLLTYLCLVSSLTVILLTPSWADAQPPRCRALCQNSYAEDACQRCRLRIPMRFGKRDSSRAVALIREPVLDVQSVVLDDEPGASLSSSREVLESRPLPRTSDQYGILLRAIRDAAGRSYD